MTKEQIEDFINRNSEEDLRFFYKELLGKLDKLNSRNDRIGLTLGILIVTYFIVDLNIISQLKLGIISVSDVTLIKLFIPVVFAFALLIFAAINAHRALVLKNLRLTGHYVFNLDKSSTEEVFYSNSFLRMIMPFSFWEEINAKYLNNGKVGCLTLIMTIPLYPIILSPFIFEYIALKDLFSKWDEGFLVKAIIILTIWLLLTTVFYYIKLMSEAVKTAKQDLK